MTWGRYVNWGMGLTGSRPTPSNSDPLSGVVTRDATSLKYRPRSAAEWTATQAVAGTSLTALFGWDCQVASGNATALYGAIPGTAGGTLAYQQAASGWSATCIKTTDNTAGYLRTSSASLPNIGTTSFLLIAHVLMPASSAGDRSIMQMGAGFTTRVALDSDASNRIVGIASPNAVNGTTGNWSQVVAAFCLINRTAGIARVGTNLEILSPTLAANPTGQRCHFGGDFTDNWNSGGQGVIDYWGFTGDATQADVKSILQTMGWSVAW